MRDLDMEVDGRMKLGEAHELATRLETAIENEVGPDIEVETHIEPMEAPNHGRDADPARRRARRGLSKLATAEGRMRDIHEVRVR